uniref:Uncharacterized protein n=1 Tax=Oryza glumipatula TaxID=40148 RepID=A0A0E0B9H7_9ORYZ
MPGKQSSLPSLVHFLPNQNPKPPHLTSPLSLSPHSFSLYIFLFSLSLATTTAAAAARSPAPVAHHHSLFLAGVTGAASRRVGRPRPPYVFLSAAAAAAAAAWTRRRGSGGPLSGEFGVGVSGARGKRNLTLLELRYV